jgi:hypothetical protein
MLAEGIWQPFGPTAGSVQDEAGQQVQVEWQGEWYEGVILEVHSPGAHHIRYNNFDESWPAQITSVIGNGCETSAPNQGQEYLKLLLGVDDNGYRSCRSPALAIIHGISEYVHAAKADVGCVGERAVRVNNCS